MQGGLLSDVITSALLINRLTAEPVTLFILQSLSIRNLPLRYKRGGRVLSPIALPLRQKALDVCCNVILVYDHSYIGDRNLTGFVDQVCGWKRVQ